MTLGVVNIVAWALLGILTLCKDRVSKFDYILAWSLLVLNLIGNCLGV